MWEVVTLLGVWGGGGGGKGCCTSKGVNMPIIVNTGNKGKAEAMLIQTLETGGGYDDRGSPRWR